MSEMLEAALNYVREGYLVVPLWPGKKTPLGKLVPNGHKDATVDEATIRAWWTQYPTANIGIRVGPESDLFVIDVDNKGGKNGRVELERLEKRYGSLPSTRIVRTPTGGVHYYFTFPAEFRDMPLRKELAPGIDLKFNGYVVAPPSVIGDDCYVTEEPR
jgi:putative DNA primase/helicase